MRKQLLILPIILFFLILAVFFYLLIIDRNPSQIPSALLNKEAPRFEAKSLLEEKKFISSEEFNNKFVLVNFFATWCKPCRDEHVFIKQFSKNKKIKIIGINYKDNSKKAVSWLNELGNPYANIAIDKDGKIAIDWGVYGIPETFLVDKNGKIKHRHVGPITKKIYEDLNLIIYKNNKL